MAIDTEERTASSTPAQTTAASSQSAPAKGASRWIEAVSGGVIEIDVDRDNGGVAIRGGDSKDPKSDSSPGVKLSEGFLRSGIPVYSGAKVDSSTDLTIGESSTSMAVLLTEDSVADVIKFYKDKLTTDAGWTNTLSSNSSDGGSLGFSNESKQLMANFTISEGGTGQKTEISIVVANTN